MRFLKPECLYLLFLLPLILTFLFFGLKSKFKIKRLWAESKLKQISQFSRKRTEIIKYCLVVLVIGLIIFSFSRPQVLYKKLVVVKKPVDILCLIDLSRSMQTKDVLYQGKRVFRLDLVKEELRNFVKDQFANNEMALIVFGSKALYRCFFTFDIGLLLFHIDYLNVEDFPPEGTDIGVAIECGLEMLDVIEKKPEVFKRPKNKRVFILISDGEDFGDSLDLAIEKIRKKKIPVYTIGIGSRHGGYIVEKIDENGNTIYMKDEDEDGQKIWSKLEERTLKKIARLTGGKHVYSSGGEDLGKALSNILERESEKQRKTQETYHDIYLYLLGAAFAFSLLVIILHN